VFSSKMELFLCLRAQISVDVEKLVDQIVLEEGMLTKGGIRRRYQGGFSERPRRALLPFVSIQTSTGSP